MIRHELVYLGSLVIVYLVVVMVLMIVWYILDLLRVLRKVVQALTIEPAGVPALSYLFSLNDIFQIQKVVRHLPTNNIFWEFIGITIELKILCKEEAKLSPLSLIEEYEFLLKSKVNAFPLMRMKIITRRGIRARRIVRITALPLPT